MSNLLWGKESKWLDFKTLEELRVLIYDHEPVEIHMCKESCLSFRNLKNIQEEFEKSKFVDKDGSEMSMYSRLMNESKIKPLANPYTFRCVPMRGYPNHFEIKWESKDEIITARCNEDLWTKIGRIEERGANDYAENTVRPVRLIPMHVRAFPDFQTARWYGGAITSYNLSEMTIWVERFKRFVLYGEDIDGDENE